MSPRRSLHAKRWALIREENSLMSDKLSTNNGDVILSNHAPGVDIIAQSTNNGDVILSNDADIVTQSIDTTDIDGSDDTTIPSLAISEQFNALSQSGVPSNPLEINFKNSEEDSEISMRKKKNNKKKMFRGPVETAVQQSVNEVLFSTVGVEQHECSFVTKNDITRTSVCGEINLGQKIFSDQGLVTNGIKKRNNRRPKGPGGEPFGGNSTLSRKENNKCLIELEGDREMLDFVENVTAVPVVPVAECPEESTSESPVMNKTPVNGFKNSILHTTHSTSEDEEIPFTTPLMSSTFKMDSNQKVDSLGVEEMDIDEPIRHNSFSGKDLPLKVDACSPDVGYIMNKEPDLLYTGTNECTSTYSDSEDMYSSDHHSSQSASMVTHCHMSRSSSPYSDDSPTTSHDSPCTKPHCQRCSPTSGDLNNSILPPIHCHDVKKVTRNTEEPDFLELERYFPTHQMRLFIGSWNMQSLKDVPNLVEEFLLPAELEVLQDIYVLGTQECSPHRRGWEVSVQATLGPTHVLVRSECLGDIHLMVLVRREMIWYMREIQSTTVACGPGGVMRNKGAVGIVLTFFGTSLLFITSHLAAQTSKVKERNMDYLRIAQYMDFSKNIISNVDSLDITDKVDCTFWFGDLNYRVTAERDVVDDLINQDMLEVLLNNDQLTTQMQTNQAFHGFSEGHIRFPPTFKFDPGTENYDTSPKQRVPSWTDRILYKSQHDAITPHVYSHCPYLKSSDHRPVYGVYMVTLQPMLLSSTIHATGWFDKRAYARGMKRRRILSENIRSVEHPNDVRSKHMRQKSIIRTAAKVVNKPVKKVLRSGTAKKSIVCCVM